MVLKNASLKITVSINMKKPQNVKKMVNVIGLGALIFTKNNTSKLADQVLF